MSTRSPVRKAATPCWQSSYRSFANVDGLLAREERVRAAAQAAGARPPAGSIEPDSASYIGAHTVSHVIGIERMEDTRQALRSFRASIAPDLYSPSSYIPWPALDSELAGLRLGIDALQRLADQPRRTKRNVVEALKGEPSMVQVFQRLFAAPSGAGFDDGRALSEEPPRTARERAKVAGLAVDLGLWRLVPRGARVEDLVRTALVASDARRRGFRRRREIEGRVAQLVASTIEGAAEALGEPLILLKPSQVPLVARSRVDDVIAVGGRPVAAISTVFEAQSGGRQTRNFSLTYPELQRELDSVPMRLILIADGRGVGEISPRVMQRLFDSVGACIPGSAVDGHAEMTRSCL